MDSKRAQSIVNKHLSQILSWLYLEKASEQMAREMYEIEYQFRIENATGSWKPKKITHDFQRIEVRVDKITVFFEYYHCGDTDYDEYSFPINWFSDKNWKSKYRKRLEENRLGAIEANRIKKAAEEEEQRKKKRVKIKKGWENEGKTGKTVGNISFLKQDWTPVLWDNEEDPEFFKTAGLEPEYPQTKI